MGESQAPDVNRLFVESGIRPYQQEAVVQPHHAFPLPDPNSLERFFQHAARTYVHGGEYVATGLSDIWDGRLTKGIPAVGIGILSMRLPGENILASKGFSLADAHAACMANLRSAIEQGTLDFYFANGEAALLKRLSEVPSVALFDYAIRVLEEGTAGGKLAKELIAELSRLRTLQRVVESPSQVTKGVGAAAEARPAQTPATAESGIARTIRQPKPDQSDDVLPSGFTACQICDLFDISKSTLFRWEQEGTISQPVRDWRNWRVYTQANLKELETKLQKEAGSAGPPLQVTKSINAAHEATQFTADQVCALLDLSKATLFRWERDGLIGHPARDWRNWRVYRQTDVDEIKKIIRARNGKRAN
jgi:DNA-binding transcriptional MerR regulator